jgi:hypothetical protein
MLFVAGETCTWFYLPELVTLEGGFESAAIEISS